MSTDIFSKSQFESSLPKGYWKYAGFIQGEECYQIEITPDIFIHIRSSVNGSGWCGDTGEDSIRCWLVDSEGKPLGSKISKYITRVEGWPDRLIRTLRLLWDMAKESGYCSDCHVPLGCYKVKKAGPNKGKLFSKCPKCGEGFKWLEK